MAFLTPCVLIMFRWKFLSSVFWFCFTLTYTLLYPVHIISGGCTGKASLSVAGYSGVFSNNKNRWGPQFALTPPSSTNDGFWHSGGERYPWIEFRMAETATVTSIKIIDRLTCCPERFERVEVKVGSVSCGVQSYSGKTTYIYNCPANTCGNSINIKKLATKNTPLHINNVEVSTKC